MKTIIKHLKLGMLLLLTFESFQLHAQELSINGKVYDLSTGEPLPGATIFIKGDNTKGTISDEKGRFSFNLAKGESLVFSYIGFKTKEVYINGEQVINVGLEYESENLEAVVVIGYGQVKKEDATGAVTAIKAEDFNKGSITNPQELVIGKIAGVHIVNSGQPGSNATIRIRGGSSLSASNDPLIVIDGIPVDNQEISGMSNPLSTIHPNDIESFTVLKDASATAIYGSRASNGVIIITTKKGKPGSSLKVNYNGSSSISYKGNEFDVLSADEFREIVNSKYSDFPDIIGLLGDYNTNWQEQIYQTAISQDHNISFNGSCKMIPYRFSLGYTDQEGILKTSSLNRETGSFSITPTLFDDHLKVDLNLKGMLIDNRFANTDAIMSALEYDPTQPVFDESSPYGGYHTWVYEESGDPVFLTSDPATDNPLAQLYLQKNTSTVKRALGNMQFNYKFHFLPELKANLNLGFDISESNGNLDIPDYASWSYDAQTGGGVDSEYYQKKQNNLLDFYLNYAKEISSIQSKIDIMFGYSWQNSWRESTYFSSNVEGTRINSDTDFESEYYLISYFGRLNYTFKDRYLLTSTIRRDGTSRFSSDNRWGIFPSLAFAWQINKEAFLYDSQLISELKLRMGYGITGQQNFYDDYPYLAQYTYSGDGARYQFGDEFVTTLRPEGYDQNLKWEETTTYNIGLDYGLLQQRITGSFDIYHRITDDLLNTIPVAAGTNLTNQILTNVGSLENSGVEFSINANPVAREDFSLDVGFNITYNKNKITKLTAVDDPTYLGVTTGSISGSWGSTIQIHSIDYPSYSFYVYEQVYDEEGKALEGEYVDRDEDGEITLSDKYHYKNPSPDIYMGFSSGAKYKNWDASFSGRVSLGNYVYNNIEANSYYSKIYTARPYLSNIGASVLKTNFDGSSYFSDMHVQDASFLRIDNVTLGYKFAMLFNKNINMRVYSSMQNVLVLTNYNGIDPEIDGGLDNEAYPHPKTILFGVNINF